MSHKKIGMTGRSKTPPRAEARPLGSKRLKPTAKQATKKAEQREPNMSEKLAALPDVEDDVRSAVDEALAAGTDPFIAGISAPMRAKNGAAEEKAPIAQNSVDIGSPHGVRSSQIETRIAAADEPSKEKMMTLTFTKLSKNSQTAMYSGAAVVLRVSCSAFPDKVPPTTIEVADGVFAPAKEKLTAEERKALRKAQPKPTLAERIAKREVQLAKDKAKLAAAEQAAQASL